MTEKEVSDQQNAVSVYEQEAEKFDPSENGVGALLRARRDLSYVMNLKNVSNAEFKENDTAIVLFDFTHRESGKRALIMLTDENRVMYMTEEFEDDFEVLREGTSEMTWAKEE